MKKQPNPIILDMDGTIIDAVPSILRSINESLEAMGYDPLTAHEIRKNNDISLDSLFRIRISEEELKRARQLYRDIQYSTFMQDTAVFPGAREALAAWKAQGRKLAIFTMRRGENARTVLSALDMLDYFDAIVGYEDAPQPKPSPEHVIHTATLLLAEPEDSYVIGDNPEDMRSGRGAGATTIGVLWGLGLKETLMDAGAHDTVEDWNALVRKIVD